MKIKIPIPPLELASHDLALVPHFKTATTLRVNDLNYGNHMGNDTVLALAHEFRIRFFAEYKQSELAFFGKGIIMSDSAIQYKSQGFWGDEVAASLWYIPTGAARFDLYYRLSSRERDMAFVKTGQVFYDYEKQKVSMPEGIQCEAYEKFLDQLGVKSLA